MNRKPKSRPKPKAKRAKPSPAKPREISDAEGELWLRSLSQTALAKLVGSQAKYLLEWESQGMPRSADGSYDATAVIAWLRLHWKGAAKSAAPAEAGDSGTQESYEALREKYRALEQKQKFLERTSAVIPKVEAERRYLAIVLQLRAALLAQSEVLGAQVAHQSPADVAKQLDARFRWMCQQFEDGWVPLPAEAGKIIDDLVAKLRADEIPTEKTEPAA